MSRNRVKLADIVGDLETDALDADVQVKSIFCLIKSTAPDAEVVWSGRSAGEEMSSEELLGALEGLTASIRYDLASDWEW